MYGRATSVSMCACMGELQVRVYVCMYGRAASVSMCVHVWESGKCEYMCACMGELRV